MGGDALNTSISLSFTPTSFPTFSLALHTSHLYTPLTPPLPPCASYPSPPPHPPLPPTPQIYLKRNARGPASRPKNQPKRIKFSSSQSLSHASLDMNVHPSTSALSAAYSASAPTTAPTTAHSASAFNPSAPATAHSLDAHSSSSGRYLSIKAGKYSDTYGSPIGRIMLLAAPDLTPPAKQLFDYQSEKPNRIARIIEKWSTREVMFQKVRG
jgi:hypothetical protein